MAARARRGAGSTAATKDGGKEDLQERKVELIREATGAADEDIRLMLAECNNDVNETTSRLIDNPFAEVKSRKQRAKAREEDRKKEGSKVIEVRRPGGGGPGRARGERSGRLSDRGLERVHDRGNRPSPGPASSKPSENGGLASEVSADWDQPNAEEDKPVAAPTLPRATYSRAPGPAAASAAEPPERLRPPLTAGASGAPTMADLFKPPPAPTPPPAKIAPPASSLQPSKHILDESAPHTDLSALGGQALSSPPKAIRPPQAAIGAPSSSSLAAAGPSSLPPPSSSLSSQDAQVQAPSTQALKGLGGAAPSRYGSDAAVAAPATSAWGPPKGPTAPVSVPPQAPKMPSSSLAANAGSSLLSSLQSAAQSAAPPLQHSDLLMSAAVDMPQPSASSAQPEHATLELLREHSQARARSPSRDLQSFLQFGSMRPDSGSAATQDVSYDFNNRLNLGASPNLHSLPPSVSSAAAAPFSKAPTSQSEFGSTAGSASQRQGFAPGFGPANGQAQMQDGQPSQSAQTRPTLQQQQQHHHHQRYNAALPHMQSQGSQTSIPASRLPASQPQANGGAGLLSSSLRAAQQSPVDSTLKAADSDALPGSQARHFASASSDFSNLQQYGSAPQGQQYNGTSQAPQYNTSSQAQQYSTASATPQQQHANASNAYGGLESAASAHSVPGSSVPKQAGSFNLSTAYPAAYGQQQQQPQAQQQQQAQQQHLQPPQRDLHQAPATRYSGQTALPHASSGQQAHPVGTAAGAGNAAGSAPGASGAMQPPQLPQVANSYGNAPHGIGYNSYGGAYHAPYQPNLYNQQYYMPQGYNGSSYGTPQGYQGNPGLSNYGNSGYSTGHALGGAAPPPHGKFPNYANQGYMGNGYDDGSSNSGLAGYGHHAGPLPGNKVPDLPGHGTHTPHMGSHGLYNSHLPHAGYQNAGRDGYAYGHGGYQGEAQGFDRRAYGHYPQGGNFKGS